MPSATRVSAGRAPEASSSVEQLLKLNEEIITARARLAQQLLLRRLATVGIVIAPLGIMALILVTKFTWRVFDMRFYNFFFGSICTVTGILAVAFFVNAADGKIETPSALKLKLALLQDRKQVQAADLQLDARYRRSSYKDEIPDTINGLRRESRFYRRIHNILQAVIIVGSLATSTVTGVSLSGGRYRIVAVVTSFSVGIAAGFTGYFKFRERGFYLQQTADSIEREYQAFELGIGDYRGLQRDEASEVFVAVVERLRAEQQQRAQNLDQPSDKAGAPGTQ